MTLHYIDLNDLNISPVNVRKYGANDVADLVTSIRAFGLLQPLLVRPVEDTFEVIAGQRRLNALRQLAEEGEIDPVPCLVMVEADEASALEASLAENIARLPMDEVDQYKAFAKLIKGGRDVAEIATAFGITDRMVTQRLALGNLHNPILTAYRKGDIEARDIRTLTMATPKQQKAWWALYKDEEAELPKGRRLKMWLFGGDDIPTEHALFDVEASGLAVTADLFGEESYFADSDAFWEAQNIALAEAVMSLKAEGWADVIVVERGAWFAAWEYCRATKEEGGKVFVTVSAKAKVTFHKGYLTQAEAKRRNKAAGAETSHATKPELTKPAQNYVDLHRHAAVRADLLGNSAIALRLIAAHIVVASHLWTVKADPCIAFKPAIQDSLDRHAGHIAIAEERAEIAALLGLSAEQDVIERPGVWSDRPDIADVFARLQALDDEAVLRILTFLIAESLSAQSPFIHILGKTLGTDMGKHWRLDETFFALIRDRQVLNAMVGEFAGEDVAAANISETAKAQRAILTACLDGTREPANPKWQPRYMAFPQGSYRSEDERASKVARDGIAIVAE